MPNFFFLIFFVIYSLPGFTQGETIVEPLSESGGKVIIRGAPAPAPAPSTTTTTTTTANGDAAVTPVTEPVSEENEDIQEIERARLKRLEKMKVVEATAKPLANPLGNPIEDMKKLGLEQMNAAALLDDKVIAVLQKVLKAGVLNHLSEQEVRTMISERIKGSLLEGIFQSFPKLLDIAVDMLRDKDALSGLLDIFVRKEDLKTYGYIWLVIFIFGLYVKSRVIKPKWKFYKRFLSGLAASLLLSVISLAVFYSFFSQELTPSIAVIAKHL